MSYDACEYCGKMAYKTVPVEGGGVINVCHRHAAGPTINLSERSSVMINGEKMEEPGRNDPCPCGSGAKFKKCCHSSAMFQRMQDYGDQTKW